jgi:hypothetical protein
VSWFIPPVIRGSGDRIAEPIPEEYEEHSWLTPSARPPVFSMSISRTSRE